MDEDQSAPPAEDLNLGGEAPEAPEPSTGEPDAEPTKDEEQTADRVSDEPAEEPQPDVPAPEPKPEEQVDERPVSRRENKRIQALTRKIAEAYQQPQPQPRSQPNLRSQRIIEEGDYDLDEINSRAEQYAQSRESQAYAQAQQQIALSQNATQFATRLDIDTPKVINKYPQLDTGSEEFDPGVTALVNEMYLKTVGYDPSTGAVQNPNIRYDEFVEGYVEGIERLASARAAESQTNIARQAAQTGPRPSGDATKTYQGDDPSQMSTEQLNSLISANLSRLPGTRKR